MVLCEFNSFAANSHKDKQLDKEGLFVASTLASGQLSKPWPSHTIGSIRPDLFCGEAGNLVVGIAVDACYILKALNIQMYEIRQHLE